MIVIFTAIKGNALHIFVTSSCEDGVLSLDTDIWTRDLKEKNMGRSNSIVIRDGIQMSSILKNGGNSLFSSDRVMVIRI